MLGGKGVLILIVRIMIGLNYTSYRSEASHSRISATQSSSAGEQILQWMLKETFIPLVEQNAFHVCFSKLSSWRLEMLEEMASKHDEYSHDPI